jgi:hypothetical protein
MDRLFYLFPMSSSLPFDAYGEWDERGEKGGKGEKRKRTHVEQQNRSLSFSFLSPLSPIAN